jgi:hypothetical protein
VRPLRSNRILFLGPEAHRLNKVAAEHGPKSPQAQGRLRRILLVARIDVALMFLIVFDMAAKPFQLGLRRDCPRPGTAVPAS